MAVASRYPYALIPLAYIKGCALLTYTISGSLGNKFPTLVRSLTKNLDNAARPEEEFGIILGDLNFLSGDDRVFKAGMPSAVASTTPPASSSGSHRTVWMIFFISRDGIGSTIPHPL